MSITLEIAYQDAAKKVEELTRANFLLRQENETLRGKLNNLAGRIADAKEILRRAQEIKNSLGCAAEDLQYLYAHFE